jgi:2-polyprenyl-3-methyl-5-hydroxy-6-metoxy-1,4-benzoquinol methylase
MQATKQGEWLETAAGLWYVVNDTVQFSDDFSHWNDGFCRLLEISDSQGRSLIAHIVRTIYDTTGKLPNQLLPVECLDGLKAGIKTFFNINNVQTAREFAPSWGTTFQGKPADTIFAASISGNAQRMIIGRRDTDYAWQVDVETEQPVTADSVTYDRSYYDSPKMAHCGMRDYVRDEDWRMEKARRLMRTVLNGAGERGQLWQARPTNVRALDVGSAMGYFRRAMAELGFSHNGIDLSPDAISICKERFGYETWQGSVFDLGEVASHLEQGFDLITLWDTIEHLDNPFSAVRLLKDYLKPDGVLVIRTPSLTAFEGFMLGDMYYSFKLDHIRYFSPRSLTSLMSLVGLRPIYIETTSHLFKGLLGPDFLFQLGARQRGADIVALYSAAG